MNEWSCLLIGISSGTSMKAGLGNELLEILLLNSNTHFLLWGIVFFYK